MTLRVLIVEDQPIDAELMVRELRRAGHEPAWQRVETEPDYLRELNAEPDVILADYKLPGFDAPRALELLRTSGEGWGETDLMNLDRVELGDADLAGPVPLGVAVERLVDETEAVPDPEAPDPELAALLGEVEPEELAGAEPAGEPVWGSLAEAGATGDEPTMRVVVLGDSDLASNGQMQSAPNATFVANAMNWLVEREALVAIPAKRPEQVRLSLTGRQLRGVTWTVLALLPGLALAAGVVVYRKRRR